MSTVTHLRPSDRTREAAHEALRHTFDLAAALNEAACFPGVVTASDKEVLTYRLRCLVQACSKMGVQLAWLDE